jgi:xanthine/CO dehydrogenase XdhC/CoxF family maturation factor
MGLEEHRGIIALHRAAPATSAVLFSLVGISDPEDRPLGSRLLSVHDGRTAGTLSGTLDTDLLHKATWHVRSGAVLEHASEQGSSVKLHLLLEPTGTAEADALLDAFEATLAGEYRLVATCLPGPGQLARIVMDAIGDVLFASDALPTEVVVDLRRAARSSGHGSQATVGSYLVFVEHLEAV